VERRKLGTQGLETAAIGLGCVSMSDFYGAADEGEAIATIHRALDIGVDFLDTSDCYGPFVNEELVGRAVKGRRDEVLISTKWGFLRNAEGDWLGMDASRARAQEACDASLRRLGVDVIDLWYIHWPDPGVALEETIEGMADMVRAGKVRYLGISNVTADQVRAAHAVHPISAVQNDFSLVVREDEAEVLPAVRELGIGYVPFSPLGRGLLTGTVRSKEELFEGDFRRTLSTFQDENLEHNLRLVDVVAGVAADVGATNAQVALAWVLSRGDDVVPIPGTAKRHRIEENTASLDVRLSAEQLDLLDRTFPVGALAGHNAWGRDEIAMANAARQRARQAGGA
jgi:aryl-alcohol dehydrogenase-like predicted oxidoreductase